MAKPITRVTSGSSAADILQLPSAVKASEDSSIMSSTYDISCGNDETIETTETECVQLRLETIRSIKKGATRVHRHPKVIYPEFARLTHDRNAGELLSLLLWYTQYYSDRYGWFDGWVYRTHDQWESETTLKRYAQQQAFGKLLALGLVEKEIRHPLTRDGVDKDKPQLAHYRIDLNRLNAILWADSHVGDQQLPPVANQQDPCCKPTPYKKTNLLTKEKEIDIHSGSTSVAPQGVPKKQNSKSQPQSSQETNPKANGVIDESSPKAEDAVVSNHNKSRADTWSPTTPKGLYYHMRDHERRVAPVPILLNEPSRKELAQLKKLLDIFGPKTLDMVKWAIDNWFTFSTAAARQLGRSNHVPRTSIGLLLEARGVLNGWYDDEVRIAEELKVKHIPAIPAAQPSGPIARTLTRDETIAREQAVIQSLGLGHLSFFDMTQAQQMQVTAAITAYWDEQKKVNLILPGA